MDVLPTIEIETGSDPSASILWLHGLGADGHDFEPIVGELDLTGLPPIRFVFPHAPVRPITVNGGMRMRGWYDVYSVDFSSRREDAAGVRDSARLLAGLTAREADRGIDDKRIVLAGFSQGGAIVLQAGLRHPRRLAGILALSTRLPLRETLAAEAAPANRDVPIFMAHGRGDTVIAFEVGEQSAAFLAAAGYPVAWHPYWTEHSLCMEEVRDIGAWLRQVLG